MEFFTPIPSGSASSLGIALVVASIAPLVLLDSDLNVTAASNSFCAEFGLDPAVVVGRDFFTLGDGEWDVAQLRSLLRATVAGHTGIDGYELDFQRPGQALARLVVNAHEIILNDPDKRWIVMAVQDVTAERLLTRKAADLVRDKAILHEELQHRVANSLQIIASVLMQSARTVQSEDVRMHLKDAHHRVMSVATLQKQLAQTKGESVELRGYFTDLCASIAASMISNQDDLTLTATVDDSATSAERSVSLGLIVTELVINALKHAFPGHPKTGRIAVDYRSEGTGWSLRVSDNGVGMPPPSEQLKIGLGTGIVEALAAQLDSKLEVSSANPGTVISIVNAEHFVLEAV